MLEGTIVASDPPRRLVMTMNPVAMGAGETTPPSRVTWEITPHETQSKLVLIHEGLDFASEQGRAAQDGWTQGISALKTYLETHNVPVAAGG
jgi:uncharacterized protein YndB with AHSA1/START domain